MANGLYTNVELIESVIVDLNTCIKDVAEGQFLQACNVVSQMSQKLIALRQSVDNDIKNREETIASLKKKLREVGVEIVDVDPMELVGEDSER